MTPISRVGNGNFARGLYSTIQKSASEENLERAFLDRGRERLCPRGQRYPSLSPSIPAPAASFNRAIRKSSIYISSSTCAKFHAETLPNQFGNEKMSSSLISRARFSISHRRTPGNGNFAHELHSIIVMVLGEIFWEKAFLDRGRARLSPGSEIPRFVPVYPRPSGVFQRSDRANLLSISLAARVQSFTPKLFQTNLLRECLPPKSRKPDSRSESHRRTLCSTPPLRVGNGNSAHELHSIIGYGPR